MDWDTKYILKICEFIFIPPIQIQNHAALLNFPLLHIYISLEHWLPKIQHSYSFVLFYITHRITSELLYKQH